MSNIQSAISAINAKFDQAFNTKNAVDISKLYAEDAFVLPAPAGAVVKGRQAVVDFFTGLIVAGVIDHQLTLVDVVEDGNLAYQVGLWAGAMVDAQGTRQTFGGNVQLVYRRQADGQWLAVTHIWN